MKELIHFAHGNGFPSPCYQQLFNHLAERFDYCYIDKIGHNPLYPVKENWHDLVTELLLSVKKQANNQSVVAVGHSMGGVLSLLAAIEEPKLFKAVILLDSPLIGRFKSNVVRIAKALGVIDKITPAGRTKGRRVHWKNREQLVTYLKTRELFKTFTDECLEDYIHYGLEHNEDGYYLRFDRDIEYKIYRTVPHIIPKLKGKLITPAALIYGDKSNVVDRMDRQYMKNYFHIRNLEIKGTHLFPMECPEIAAKKIINVIDELIT